MPLTGAEQADGSAETRPGALRPHEGAVITRSRHLHLITVA